MGSPGISVSSKFATADRTSGYGDSARVVRSTGGANRLGWMQTIINSVFVKVWVEGRVVIFRVGVAGVGRILGRLETRVLERSKGH